MFLEQHYEYDGEDHLFTRHYSFIQCIQDVQYNKAWQDANTNVLVIYGGADIPSISPHNSELLVNALNTMHPGTASYKFLPDTDHSFIKVGTKQDLLRLRQNGQFENYARDNFNPALIEMVDTWIKQIRENPKVGSNL
ncbi:hypothetical protein DXT99_01825 [Pontibacter diazotrophicus]|uniref:Dienelactone hydrolase domain-containing protein n=1 Tax=Pontibacter diazotrophicus TaxID=1400979 RepID=A0A3D8LHS7_9BACT|nr:hypothetical protein [Pontibacter diazotrophicus]RDV16876.1 hypothetical protein DXT99_01825 [Pontibacter diazotrophicus]